MNSSDRTALLRQYYSPGSPCNNQCSRCSATSVTVICNDCGSGVMSITGSTTVNISGTSQNPIVSTTQAFSILSPPDQSLPTTTITGSGTSSIPITILSSPDIPIVQGAVYSLNGVYIINTTSTSATISLNCVNGDTTFSIITVPSIDYIDSTPSLHFSATFPANASFITLQLDAADAADGDSTTITLSNLYLTRIL